MPKAVNARRSVVVGVLVVALASLALPAQGATGDRLGGADRFDTARLIAMRTFATAETAVVATGEQFADALAGNFLAGNRTAPILLTNRATLPQPTREALTALGVKNVVLLGQTEAITTNVENAIRGMNIQVSRIGGANRFETARDITLAGATTVGTVDGKRTAILATGLNFPDALAAGPLAYAGRLPTLLTERTQLSTPARDAIRTLNIEQVLVIGGSDVINQSVETEVKAINAAIVVTRLEGADRTETARKVSEFALSKLGFTAVRVYLARGDAFPDALAGGPAAGKTRSPQLLTVSATTLGTETQEFINAHEREITVIVALGGDQAISATVLQEAVTTANEPGGPY